MTIHVNMHEAKTKLSKLVEAAANGEQVVICRDGEPVAEITAVGARKGPRIPGRLKGVLPPMSAGAFAPLSEEDMADWYGAPTKSDP